MREIVYYAAVLAALLGMTGCIDYTETITLDENGGGDISVSYSVTSDFLRDFGRPDSETLKTEEEDLRNRFEGDGITISRISVADGNDARLYSVECAFNGDTALNALEFFEDFSTFGIKNGKTLEYSRTILTRVKSEKKADEETVEKLATLFEDNLFTFTVRMPEPVTASNGIISEDRYTVKWVYSFGEILLLDKPAELTAECRITD